MGYTVIFVRVLRCFNPSVWNGLVIAKKTGTYKWVFFECFIKSKFNKIFGNNWLSSHLLHTTGMVVTCRYTHPSLHPVCIHSIVII
jgi:hypothetical protein